MGNRLESVKVHWKCYYLISRCPRHRERTLFVPKKVYKFDHAKICLCIYSASCTSNLNKTCRFLCFTRKATSQGVIKKCFWTGVGKINNHYKSDQKTELGIWGALRYNNFITLQISLEYRINKTTHVWQFFILLYE